MGTLQIQAHTCYLAGDMEQVLTFGLDFKVGVGSVGAVCRKTFQKRRDQQMKVAKLPSEKIKSFVA